MKFHTIQFKIFISTMLCIMVVSLAGSLYLYRYINNLIYEKSRHIDELYLTTVSNQLDVYFTNYIDLALQCSNDSTVVKALASSDVRKGTSGRLELDAQEQLGAYINSFMASSYVNKLVAFNLNGTMIQTTNSRHVGSPDDYQKLLSYEKSLNWKQNQLFPYIFNISTSITSKNQLALALLCPVFRTDRQEILGYVYIEISTDLLTDLISPYNEVNNFFLTDTEGHLLTPSPSFLPPDLNIVDIGNGIYSLELQSYEFSCHSFPAMGLKLYSCVPYPLIGNDTSDLVGIVLLVLIISLFAGIVLALLTSYILSRPIQRLNQRLHKIVAGDFSFDPDIEHTADEIGQIGHTVNEMTHSFSNLLKDTQQMYRQQRNIEISLLQSQVNPHFLYNTLDSIHWMAVIQKSPGIQQITRGLSNLMKNLAKGTEDHIPLAEELSLLNDYVAIQSIRYMETFELIDRIPESLTHYRIIKFTLQPLVENAIFHGIEPKGTCGSIILDGFIDKETLCLTVTDDGIGIPADKLALILDAPLKVKNKSSLNSIGAYNVNQRLKLVYGAKYGLTYESIANSYTKVIIRLPLEE